MRGAAGPGCRQRTPARPGADAAADGEVAGLRDLAVADLAMADLAEASSPSAAGPRIDLLAATGSGAPNVVSLRPVEARRQAVAAVDDAYVAMPLALAQRLVHGGADRASAVVVQLHRGADAPAAKARIEAILAAEGPPLEVRTLDEFNPMAGRVLGMFRAIFGFISAVVGMVVLFTVVNTMTMVIMERVGEIGTLRAMGLRRSGVRAQFVAEGALLGVAGATAGIVAALLLANGINAAGLSWTPPSSAEPSPLRILLDDVGTLGVAWAAMVLVAAGSALLPAGKAARMPIVDALRHV